MSLLDGIKARFGGAGFIAPPFLISWNITKRCNLRCSHCYLDATELEGKGETSTAEAKGFIDQIAGLNQHAMLILTGGEPLMRPDCLELADYAAGKGLTVVLGTNGTLLNDSTIKNLVQHGVKGVGISLDSTSPDFHNRFRGVAGAWENTVAGIDALNRAALPFQLQLTVTRDNRRDIPGLIEFAVKNGAKAVNIFFLVCTGRGQNMTDLKPEEYEEVLNYLVEAEREFEGKVMVRARCAPHFLRVAAKVNPESALLKGETSGCIAGTGYLRITPDGDVTPCPYMPAENGTSSLKKRSLKDIWENNPTFKSLRDPVYSGRCKDCEFSEACGGCRARSLASGNGLMGEDPWCTHEPTGKPKIKLPEIEPEWTAEAEERLGNIPMFLRPMVKKGVERYAKAKGLRSITPEVMSELRKRAGR